MVHEIKKGKLKKFIRQRLLEYFPDYLSHFNKKLLNNALIFTQGYLKCLLQMGETPMKVEDIESLVLQEAYEHILDKIRNES